MLPFLPQGPDEAEGYGHRVSLAGQALLTAEEVAKSRSCKEEEDFVACANQFRALEKERGKGNSYPGLVQIADFQRQMFRELLATKREALTRPLEEFAKGARGHGAVDGRGKQFGGREAGDEAASAYMDALADLSMRDLEAFVAGGKEIAFDALKSRLANITKATDALKTTYADGSKNTTVTDNDRGIVRAGLRRINAYSAFASALDTVSLDK